MYYTNIHTFILNMCLLSSFLFGCIQKNQKEKALIDFMQSSYLSFSSFVIVSTRVLEVKYSNASFQEKLYVDTSFECIMQCQFITRIIFLFIKVHVSYLIIETIFSLKLQKSISSISR